jgi:hypothetical protein
MDDLLTRCGGGAEPPSKRAYPWSFLLACTQYVCASKFCGMPFPVLAFRIPCFEGSIGLNDRSRTLLASVNRRQPAVPVALATEVPGVGGAPRGVIGTEMSGARNPGWRGLSPPSSLGTCVRSCSDRIYSVLLTLCPRPSIQGRWRVKQSSHAPKSPPWSGCSTRHVTPTFYKNKNFVQIGVHIKMHIKL